MNAPTSEIEQARATNPWFGALTVSWANLISQLMISESLVPSISATLSNKASSNDVNLTSAPANSTLYSLPFKAWSTLVTK